MGKKNWIEFDNQEEKFEETAKGDNFKKRLKINISKQKKGKKGKTITVIKGLGIDDEISLKELLKSSLFMLSGINLAISIFKNLNLVFLVKLS